MEPVCKDALSSKLFKDLEEILLRLYLIYAKLPKKSRELSDIATDLKVFEFPKGRNKSVRSQRSRWICHKQAALQRFVDRYGAYVNHLITLSEDPSTKADDQACIKGYLKKWKHCRMLVGAAFYIDVLKPASVLSLTLQGENTAGREHSTRPQSYPQVSKVTQEDSRKGSSAVPYSQSGSWQDKGRGTGWKHVIYQGAAVDSYTSHSIKHCTEQALEDLRKLEERMKERLEWSDIRILRAILVFLDTQSLSCQDGSIDDVLTEIKFAVEILISKFREPL